MDRSHSHPHSKGTPEGFRFLTNIMPTNTAVLPYGDEEVQETEDELIERLISTHGEENVVITEPAYDQEGNPWNGRAIHVREGIQARLFPEED